MRVALIALQFFMYIVLSAGLVGASPVYFEGEGWFEPTLESREAFDPQAVEQRLLFHPWQKSGDHDITVQPLATNFPDISLYVTVLDPDGRPVAGLEAGDFGIREQSSSETSPTDQTITGFSETGVRTGINVMLVFDVSGSMHGRRLQDAQNAAVTFINSMNPNDRIGLVSFAGRHQVTLQRPMDWVYADTNNSGTYDIIERVNALVATGVTALYNGTMLGLDELESSSHPKAVIAFTDGDTFDDTVTINQVIARANNTNIPLYTIGLGLDPQNLRDMASQTGGEYFYAPQADDMRDIYSRIATDVTSQYIIDYTTHAQDYDGTTRTVTVLTQNSSGAGTYEVNFRPQIVVSQATKNLSNQSQDPNQALPISGTVIDRNDPLDDMSATLFYRWIGDTAFTSQAINLTDGGGGDFPFTVEIPAETVKEPGVEYYIRATDGKLTTYSPFNYQASPYAIAVLQNNSPVITHTPVTQAVVNLDIQIEADVTDPDAGDSVQNVKLYYRVKDPRQQTAYHSVDMTSTSGNTYSAAIPANYVTLDGVEYFLSAWDSRGSRSDAGSAENPFVVNVITEVFSKVVYHGNGHTDGEPPVDAGEYAEGDQITVLDPGNMVRTDYDFAGWNTMSDGRGTTYQPGDTLDMGDANLNLYAVWTEAGNSVVYHGNGHTGGEPPVDTGKYTQGTPVSVLDQGDLIRFDHTFAGWNTASGGNGDPYQPGDTLNMGAAELNLYAIWTETGNSPPVVAVAQQQIFLQNLGEMAVLDASPSYDPDGDPLFFSWRESYANPYQGLIPLASDAMSTLNLYFPAPGRYVYEVRVSDGVLMSAETRTITVYVPGRKGLVGFSPSDTLVRVPDALVRVHANAVDAQNNVNMVDMAITDSLGRYVLEHVEPENTTTGKTYYARVEREGFQPTEVLNMQVRPDPGAGDAQENHHIGRGYVQDLTGVVRNPDGQPIEGALAAIIPGQGGQVFANSTDSGGRFTLSNVPQGSWIMQLRHQDYRPEVRDIYVREGMPELSLTMQGEPQDGTLTGTVLLAGTDRPLPGVEVTLGTGESTQSNTQGIYTFSNIPQGDYILTATRAGFEPKRIPVVQVRGGTTTLNLPMSFASRGPTVFGTVTDAESNAPVRLATVGVVGTAGLLTRSDVSDYTGYYHLRDVPLGDQTIRVSAPGYETRTISYPIAASMEMDIRLQRSPGWVAPTRPDPELPVAAVVEPYVFLENLNQSAFLDASPSTGANLRYLWRENPDNPVLGLLPAGFETMSRIQISGFSKPGIYIYELQVQSGGEQLSANTATVAAFLPGLSGNVHASPTDGIIGLSGATVRAYVDYADAVAFNEAYVDSQQTADRPAGNFFMRNLSPGSYWIVARAAVGTGYRQYGPVLKRVNHSSSARHSQFNVPRDEFSLSGTITDSQTGALLENVRVVAAPGSLSETYRTSTDATGTYHLPAIPRGSGQQVLLMREGYRSTVLTLNISENTIRDATLTADASGQLATLSGKVVSDYQGIELPVYNAEVIIGSGLARTFTDANGDYEFAGLPPGLYFGRIRKPGYISVDLASLGFLQLNAGENTIDRLLPFADPGPVIRGTVITDQGQPIDGVTIRVLQPAGPFAAWLNSPRAAALRAENPELQARVQTAANEEPTQSDAGGIFQLTDLPHGPRLIVAHLPDGRVVRQTVNVDGNQVVVLNERDSVLPDDQWTLTYIAGTGGTITGTLVQTVANNGNGTPVTAVPDSGYSFSRWSDRKFLTAQRQDINVTEDITVTAEFSANPEVDITPTVPGGGGRVEGGGSHRIGSLVEFRAIADPGYVFSHWTLNDVRVPNAGATHTFTITEDMNLTAHFRKAASLPGVLMLLLDE